MPLCRLFFSCRRDLICLIFSLSNVSHRPTTTSAQDVCLFFPTPFLKLHTHASTAWEPRLQARLPPSLRPSHFVSYSCMFIPGAPLILVSCALLASFSHMRALSPRASHWGPDVTLAHRLPPPLTASPSLSIPHFPFPALPSLRLHLLIPHHPSPHFSLSLPRLTF